jgi:hypothetical protein
VKASKTQTEKPKTIYVKIEYEEKDYEGMNPEQYTETEMMLMVEHTYKNGYPFTAQLIQRLQNESIDNAFAEIREILTAHSDINVDIGHRLTRLERDVQQ